MSKLQTHFDQFHDTIKLGNFDENQNLRDKRDLLLEDLKKKIPENAPSFTHFNQGSYAMHTGVQPKDGNYDIDVGLIFKCTREDYDDPVKLKQMVKDALNYGNRTVKIMQPCVTVEYIKNGNVDYHVDLAIYAERTNESILDLARGKENSDAQYREWEISDPKGLIDCIQNKYDSKEDKAQMRRCIRYLKRWRDHKLPGKPFSIALTCAIYHWFQPSYDIFFNQYYDIDALILFVKEMKRNFNYNEWLTIRLPVEPYSDLNSRMTKKQMQRFKEKLEDFEEALCNAEKEDDEDKACKYLKKQFGNEFPIPEKKDLYKKAETSGFAPAGASA